MATCSIALGGNLGDTAQIFEQALRSLNDDSLQLQTVSRFYATPPMGHNAGEEFLNAAAIVDTTLKPLALLQHLHEIETELARSRELHWGPRSLDLDLLFYDQTVICSEKIVVPHPALWYRRFVLVPLLEIVADHKHPILNESIFDLSERVHEQPLKLVIAGEHHTERDVVECEQHLQKQFGKDNIRLSCNEDSDSRHAFATVVVDTTTEFSQHQQPPHEVGRTIRIAARKHPRTRQLQSALTDICTAALGEVTPAT